MPDDLREAFTHIGQHLPHRWRQGRLTQPQKKALLRCLIDKVVLHRVARDRVRARIVWREGATTTREVPVPVGALAHLTGAADLERLVVELTATGRADEAIAAHLTQQGYRSPQHQIVLPSTVKAIRLRHGMLRQRSQSHPRHVAGCRVAARADARRHPTLALRPHPQWDYPGDQGSCFRALPLPG